MMVKLGNHREQGRERHKNRALTNDGRSLKPSNKATLAGPRRARIREEFSNALKCMANACWPNDWRPHISRGNAARLDEMHRRAAQDSIQKLHLPKG